jgi:hypothetical protein
MISQNLQRPEEKYTHKNKRGSQKKEKIKIRIGIHPSLGSMHLQKIPTNAISEEKLNADAYNQHNPRLILKLNL